VNDFLNFITAAGLGIGDTLGQFGANLGNLGNRNQAMGALADYWNQGRNELGFLGQTMGS